MWRACRINGWSFLGAFIVTGSVVGLGVRKWRRERQHTAVAATAAVKQVEVVVKGEVEGGVEGGEVESSDEASTPAFHEAREVSKDQAQDCCVIGGISNAAKRVTMYRVRCTYTTQLCIQVHFETKTRIGKASAECK